MDPVSITSLISFGKDAIEVVDRIYELFKAISEAPKKLRELLDEVGVLRGVLCSVADVFHQISVAEEEVSASVGQSYRKAFHFIQKQADRLYTQLYKYRTSSSMGRWRVWRISLEMVLGDKEILEYLGTLERGKSLLAIAQLGLQQHMITRQTRQIDSSTQKLDESIKLNSAIASICLVQAKAQVVPSTYQCSHTIESTTIALPGRKRYDDQDSYSSMRQELAELKTTVSALMAPPLKLAHIDPQPLGPLYDQLVCQLSNKGKKTAPQLSREVIATEMASELGQSAIQNTVPRGKRLGCTAEKEYAKSRFTDRDSVYVSSWFGTITLTRKYTSSKRVGHGEEELEAAGAHQTTFIQFTPAIWLTKTAYVLSLQKELTFATSSSVSLALQPVRYVNLPSAATRAINTGDLATLQQMLRAGQISLHDRECRNGYSLLELSFGSLNSLWFVNEYSSFSRTHVRDIVRTARWIFARGTSADTQCQDVLLPNSFSTASLRENDMCNADDIEQMEQLLIEVSENEPSVQRCRRLLSFAVWNPDHSLYVDCVISDIAGGDFTEDDLLSLSVAEDEYWAKGSLVASGLEASVLYALLKLRAEYRKHCPKTVPRNVVRNVLRGPRRILFEMLKVALEIPPVAGIERTTRATEVVSYTASFLRICRDLPLLEDGFGDLLSAYAHEHRFRDVWDGVLRNSAGYSDGIDLALLRFDLDDAIALFIRGDSVNRLQNIEDWKSLREISTSSTSPTLASYILGIILLILRSLL